MKLLMLPVVLLAVGCAPKQEDKPASVAPVASAWATSYGERAILPEKVFSMKAKACEDALPEAAIEVGSDGKFRLTRKNCVPIMPPAEIAAADVDHLTSGGISVREGDFLPLNLQGGYSLDDSFGKALRRLAGTVCIAGVYVDGIGTLGKMGAGKTVVRSGLLTAYVDEKADIDSCADRIRRELPELKIGFVLDYTPAIIISK